MKLLKFIHTPRFWVLVASLANRGAGFITSFIISRFIGAGALGLYSSVLNTASSVVSPFLQVVSNNSTIMAVDGHRKGNQVFSRFAFANILVSLVLSLVSFTVFYSLYGLALIDSDKHGINFELMQVVAASVIVGQVSGAVIQGFYYGAGKFLEAAKVFTIVALLALLSVLPVVYYFGLKGTFCLLLVSSIMPLILLGQQIFIGQKIYFDLEMLNAIKHVFKRLVASLPTIGAAGINATVSWLCAIYYVQHHYGMEGVGVVAVAIQWQNLSLIPATSWGGVTLRAINECIADSDKPLLLHTIVSLIKKNLIVTLMMAIAIAICSNLIAAAYHLQDTSIVMLICVNAISAVVASINNVFERLLLCLDKQSLWFVFSVISFAVQLVVTKLWINDTLSAVAYGQLAGVITLNVCCLFSLNSLLKLVSKDKA